MVPDEARVPSANLIVESVGGVPLQHYWEIDAADATDAASTMALKVPILSRTRCTGAACASAPRRTK